MSRPAHTLAERTSVAVDIFDAAGARVARLDQGVRNAGSHTVEWNGRDDAGRAVSSGVYFYRLDGVGGVAPAQDGAAQVVGECSTKSPVLVRESRAFLLEGALFEPLTTNTPVLSYVQPPTANSGPTVKD